MSTIKVDTIKGRSTGGSVDAGRLVSGQVNAWAGVNTNTATVLDSFNVSSLTDTATGRNSINFTNSTLVATYCRNISCVMAATTGSDDNQISDSVSKASFRTTNINTTNVDLDSQWMQLSGVTMA